MGLITLWKNYLPWTQAVVVAPLIGRAKRRWLEAAWFLVLVSTTVVFIVQSYYLIKDYLSYQKTTNIRLFYEPEAPFPAVTFCNLNPFKKTMVHHSQELTNLLATYTYVNKVKQEQLESGTTAVARTTTTSPTESHERRKRQASGTTGATLAPAPPGCGESLYSYPDTTPPQTYSVWTCGDGTAYVEFGACNVTNLLRTKSFPTADINNWRSDMALVFYTCFHHYCTDGGCGIYQDGFNAIMAERTCLQGASSNLALSGIVAQALASYCGYSDASCSLGMSGKEASAYGGYYYHRACGAEMTTIFEDCNSPAQIGFNYTHSYDTTCDKNKYIDDMAAQVIQSMDYSECGAVCSPPPCTYTNQDACMGLNYNEFLCAISTCNVSTTPWFTSTMTAETTTLETTLEPTTTETQSSSTTPEVTTTISTSTIETTTAPLTMTTQLTTTTTDALTTSTAPETTSASTETSASVTTTTEPATTTSVTLTSSTDASTTTTATTTDATSTSSSTSSSAITSEAASTTTDAQSSTLTLTSETPTTTTSLGSTSTSTETSTTAQVTTTAEPTTTENTSTTGEITSTTLPETTITASQAISTTPGDTTTAYPTTTEAQTTSSGTLLPSTTTLDGESSTSTMYTTLETTMTELATSTEPIASTTSIELSSSSTKTSTTGRHSTSRGSSAMTSSKTSPTEASSLSTTEAITAGHSSTFTNAGSTASSDTSITETTPTAQASAVSASSMRAIEESTTTAPAEGVASSTPSQSATPTERKSWPTSSPPSMQTVKTSTERSSGSEVATSVAATDQAESTMTTVAGNEDSAQTTGKAVGSSNQSTLALSSLTTALRASSSVTESAGTKVTTITTGDRPSQRSSSPSPAMPSPVGSTGSINAKTNPVDQGEASGTTESNTQSTKATGNSPPTDASNTTKSTKKSAINDVTTAAKCVDCKGTDAFRTQLTTRILASPFPLTEQDAWWTTAAGGNGTNRSTTLSPTSKVTTNATGQDSDYTTRTIIGSTPSTGSAGAGRNRTSSPSSASGTQKGSTAARRISTSATNNDGPDSTTANTKESDTSGSDADNFTSFTRSTTMLSGNSQPQESKKYDHPSTKLGGGENGPTMPTTAENGNSGQNTTTKTDDDPSNRQSTTRSLNDTGNHATNGSAGNGSDGDSNSGSSRTSTTPNGSANNTIKQHNGNDDAPGSNSTTRSPAGDGSELTTTRYEDYLKNIKLNLSLDFDLEDLSDEQKRNLADLSNAYGLDPANDQVVIDANMKQALQIVAAKMSPELRQILGFQLKELVSSCIIDGDPCDTNNDFKQTFDVDYGNCYTYNYDTPVKHITRRSGSKYGLRMTIISNSTESLPSTSEEGVKIVVHSQEIAPFPNVEGYKSPVGQVASLQVTYNKLAKLGAPYGECSTLDSIAKNKQPFYYNGSYSTEGCFRSCFQQNIATACGCADSRFPSPTDMDVPFCDPLEPTKYKCMEAYIEDNGDYFFVDNCQCYDACDDTAYRPQISESIWPAGNFFYGGFCPLVSKLEPADCSVFYSNNGMTLEVSFAQLGYEMIEEDPASTAWDLINELAGNSGLWVGYTMLGFTECFLIGIQICLWVFRCPKELPEVPSCRHRNFFAEVDEDSDSDEYDNDDGSATLSNSSSTGASDAVSESHNGFAKANGKLSVISMSRMAPKNFDNSIGEKVLTRREVKAKMPTKLELYDAKHALESVDPITAHTSEHAGHFTHI